MILVLVCGLLLPATARAQPADPPIIELRTAAGFSNFLHGDIDGTAPSMRVAVRIGAGRFAIEPEAAFAWIEKTDTFSGGTTNTERTRFQGLGLNAIGRWPGARVSPYIGAGLGMYSHRRRNQTVSPAGTFSREFNSPGDAGAQVMGGLDVTIAARVSAFGEMRLEVRSFQDPGGGSVVQGFGGVAIRLW